MFRNPIAYIVLFLIIVAAAFLALVGSGCAPGHTTSPNCPLINAPMAHNTNPGPCSTITVLPAP